MSEMRVDDNAWMRFDLWKTFSSHGGVKREQNYNSERFTIIIFLQMTSQTIC